MKCSRCGAETLFQGYYRGEILCKRCYDEALRSLGEPEKKPRPR